MVDGFINGDLGRLSGLLKLWLTDDVRTALFGQAIILVVLSKIEAKQEGMGKIMTKVVMPRSESWQVYDRPPLFLRRRTSSGFAQAEDSSISWRSSNIS